MKNKILLAAIAALTIIGTGCASKPTTQNQQSIITGAATVGAVVTLTQKPDSRSDVMTIADALRDASTNTPSATNLLGIVNDSGADLVYFKLALLLVVNQADAWIQSQTNGTVASLQKASGWVADGMFNGLALVPATAAAKSKFVSPSFARFCIIEHFSAGHLDAQVVFSNRPSDMQSALEFWNKCVNGKQPGTKAQEWWWLW